MEFSYIIIKCMARYVPCDLTMKRWHIIGIDMGGKYEALLTNYVIIFHLFGLIIRFCCSVVRLPARLFVYSSSLSLFGWFSFTYTHIAYSILDFSISMDAETVIDAPLLDIYVLFLYHIICYCLGLILRFHSKLHISLM